jgi:hypothetical protein
MATLVGQRAAVKKLVLTHHNFGHDDDYLSCLEQEIQAVLPIVSFAREGMTIEL